MTSIELHPQLGGDTTPKKEASHVGGIVLTFSLFLALLSYAAYYVIFDPQNSFLQMMGISNVGEQLKLAEEDQEEHYERFNAINTDIERLEKNIEVHQVKQVIAEIKAKRIMWTEVLDTLKTVTASVPQDFIDDLVITHYSGNTADQTLAIDVKLKNEKVFTLNANLVDAISDYPDFYDVEFKNYSRSVDESSIQNTDYETDAHITFKYRRNHNTIE